MIELLKQKARAAGFTAVVVLVVIQWVLPSMFDTIMTLVAAGVAYAVGRIDKDGGK